jgi:hypothetical protein
VLVVGFLTFDFIIDFRFIHDIDYKGISNLAKPFVAKKSQGYISGFYQKSTTLAGLFSTILIFLQKYFRLTEPPLPKVAKILVALANRGGAGNNFSDKDDGINAAQKLIARLKRD